MLSACISNAAEWPSESLDATWLLGMPPTSLASNGLPATAKGDAQPSQHDSVPTWRAAASCGLPHPAAGKAGYLAPELQLVGAIPSEATDVFAFGRVMEAVLAELGEEAAAPTWREFIGQLTAADPAERPSAAAACRHVFFTGVSAWRKEQSRSCAIGAAAPRPLR
ncbi:hypothetical protein CYMTET_31370 [Cymbomonas tetramitiformis]|uniref:Protein kinase domain-containing protein n=1 Tax=Cymbomonas tetramitiformis TaxID=36881 RepID=A0AAE0FGW9_9CHLO|nr:hypothetical protein CYMTET_31370 [Cymbomonas tetramitiformis]